MKRHRYAASILAAFAALTIATGAGAAIPPVLRGQFCDNAHGLACTDTFFTTANEPCVACYRATALAPGRLYWGYGDSAQAATDAANGAALADGVAIASVTVLPVP